jgi:hypothetical protein
MNKELKDKLESLKSDGKKKKGCTDCKKKKPIIELPPIIEDEDYIPFIPTMDDIRLAYVELGNRGNDKREFINKVYRFLFNDDFNFNCGSCVNKQSRRLKNYINDNSELKIS